MALDPCGSQELFLAPPENAAAFVPDQIGIFMEDAASKELL